MARSEARFSPCCCQAEARIQYDIDTLRNGSLVFDLMIIAKTLAVVWRDQNAY